ncbi:NARE ribosyltransferase, partial [Daphoenositta chrysoptera]|nr:NARE ribosyltransferase [Daphoenositta chrysoptera]
WPLPSMAPLAHTLALLAMAVATAAIDVVHMNMVPDSFDDQYRGCRDKMMAVLPALNRSEQQQNKNFSQVWAKATAAWHNKKFTGSPLSSDQAIAIMAYTMNDVYEVFNNAVSIAGRSSQQYREKFHFKTLHFLLTDALATLRDSQGQQCCCVVRGVHNVQFKAQIGDIVRFGRFASTSLCKDTADYFGTDTVFQVHTCHGVDIRDFSVFPQEEEVLVPPFETFKVTDVTWDGKSPRIELRSAGTHSNYNCEWLQGDVTEGTTWGD